MADRTAGAACIYAYEAIREVEVLGKLRIGVIGAGSMGRNHVRILSTEKADFEWIGFYDTDGDRARELSAQFSVPAFSSMEALMEQADAVTIAAPSSCHKEIALEAARRGLHALVEKPLALTLADAEEISHAFARAGRILAVGHVERFNPVVTELCKLVRHEKIRALEVRRYSPYNGRITDADVVQDLMVHDIDLVCNVLIKQPLAGICSAGQATVSGRLDFVQSLMKFADGTSACIGASRITESKVREIVVHTDRSYILADLLGRSLSVLRNTNLVIDEGEESAYRQDSVTQKIFVPMVEPLRMELMDFVECVHRNRQPAADGQAACRTIEIVETIVGQAMKKASSETGGRR